MNVLGSGTMLLSVNYYDRDGRVVTSKSQHHLGGTDLVSSSYDFSGQLTESTRVHATGGSTTATVYNAYSYDHAGRKISTRQNINSQGEVTLNRLEYNEVGQLKNKRLHSTDGTNFYQHTAFGYNERGWMRTSSSTEFNMELGYETGTYPQYNGNIANQKWGSSLGNVFTYQYDKLDRLTHGNSTGTAMSEVLTYDVMGNIASLSRDGATTGVYHYLGNRLNYIIDGPLATNSYAYDNNGNATLDGRLATYFSYNHLNLPATAAKSGLSLAYTYDATGQKLKKVSNITGTTDYVDGIQYTNGTIDFIQIEEGRAVNSSGSYKYEYNLSDHLGNVRYSFDIYNGAVRKLQGDDYYAFGLRYNNTAGTNNYLYNGKELQDELGQYDYGARFYDPVIGRWNSVDPLADHSFDLTSYHYCSNNPINRLDPDGRCDKPNCPHKFKLTDRLPEKDPDGDQIGFIKSSTENYRSSSPVKAAILDLSFDVLNALGFNTLDNAYYKEGKLTTGEKVSVSLAVLTILDPPLGRGGRGKGKSSASGPVVIKEEISVPTANTSRAARRQAMRDSGIPTSQQPTSQHSNASGKEYRYDVPESWGGTSQKSVQQQTMDSSHPGMPHWEAGKVKTENGTVRTNNYGRAKLENKNKTKVNY
ncbi:RHS repeat-associated core domain-containing protein [Pedobacter polaris]|uniref:RHS repeat-associated core domain-containing protein n=1 Tax=Pedobacter polaris TaxID=2571273 RepID=A0A4U1CXX0_9SPHI|nr:RHS repeat-associated core domain-containing protein [Pedobacter polaris]TKC12038.1 RHS repeat-associated core domain-containing protein [Pedobacter polaris]